VKNAGTVGSPASQVRVEFSASYGRWFSVPSLAAGATYHLAVFDLRLDENCYDGRCTAKVIADSGNSVVESNETNNTRTRFCAFHY
jgi:subtilase family serine protease